MYKLDLQKPDGRNLYLYSRSPIDPELTAPMPAAAVGVGAQSELRWHPLREEWVAYASHRQNRTFMPPPEFNPLAPTSSEVHPTELPAGAYDVAVFENLFASLQLNARHVPEHIVPTMAGKGVCEVIVFTQDPHSSLGKLSLSHLNLVLEVWSDRYRQISAHADIRYILPFENRGVEMGVTLHHPHGQIYSYPFIPPIPQQMLRAQQGHYLRTKRSLLGDLLLDEIRDGRRIIYLGKQTVAFVPVCARYPYEVWVVPLRHVTSLTEMNAEEVIDLAFTLKMIFMKYDALWNRPLPYLMVLYAAPCNGKTYNEWHFHIQISPPYRTRERLKFLAGTELGAGMFVNDSLPEEKAAELRSIEVSFD